MLKPSSSAFPFSPIAAEVLASNTPPSVKIIGKAEQPLLMDPLTGIYNRQGIQELGQREIDLASSNNRPLSAVLLDIDHFKRINDLIGEQAGDVILCIVTERIRKIVRELDLLSRYDGGEFLVLLPEIDQANAGLVAERIRQSIEDFPFLTGQGEIQVTISAGVSQVEGTDSTLDDLITKANKALFTAKQNGRNCVAVKINGNIPKGIDHD
jgi:diguanylate cyclase (GGDEF)-like protein